ncbi:hypothetical protein BRM1_13885 [Brevibacterium sp. BRM-1]|uniref:hypothetical protein n=1 Tax=Brevibacterium sp. BRM-1 TaxID=2999062 RepID=UPI0022806A9D|nr:hypothetical protein [Brevibacterium sp. BRM-1]WAL40290.1 hypothetical protein BRM1_13885 [Brevibacterium sp. BRM-1]
MKTTLPAAAAMIAGTLLLSGCQYLPWNALRAAPDAAPANAAAAPTTQAPQDASDQVVEGQGSAPQDEDEGGSVSASAYRGGASGTRDTFYFQTPSGKHNCAISAGDVGCNSTAIPASAPDVEGVEGYVERPNAIAFGAGSAAHFEVTGDPAYIYQGADGNFGEAKVLPYGQTLRAHGVTCSVSESRGVSCYGFGHGFTFSSQDYTLD